MNLFVPATFAPFVVGQFPAADPLQSELVGKGERAVCRSLAFVQKTMSARAVSSLVGAALLAVVALTPSTRMAQPVPSGPPAVGVITVERRPMTDTHEFNGRIQAINSVNIVARVSAFLEQQLFSEGTDVKKGDLLYVLERPPYQATVDAQKAAVAQAKAQLENGNIELSRKRELVQKNAGTQQALDTAEATQRTQTAQVQAAEAQLESAQINLDYTEIRAPIDGRIGRTSVTIGNVVGPTSGTLATIVSQDPMYVTFPIPTRRPSIYATSMPTRAGSTRWRSSCACRTAGCTDNRQAQLHQQRDRTGHRHDHCPRGHREPSSARRGESRARACASSRTVNS